MPIVPRRKDEVGLTVPNAVLDRSPVGTGLEQIGGALVNIGQGMGKAEDRANKLRQQAFQDLEETEKMKFKADIEREAQVRLLGKNGYMNLFGEQIKAQPNVVEDFEQFVEKRRQASPAQFRDKLVGIAGSISAGFRENAWKHTASQASVAREAAFDAAEQSSAGKVLSGLSVGIEEDALDGLAGIEANERQRLAGRTSDEAITKSVREKQALAAINAATALANQGKNIVAMNFIDKYRGIFDDVVLSKWGKENDIRKAAASEVAEVEVNSSWGKAYDSIVGEGVKDDPRTPHNEADLLDSIYRESARVIDESKLTETEKSTRRDKLNELYKLKKSERDASDAFYYEKLQMRVTRGEFQSVRQLEADTQDFINLSNGKRNDITQYFDVIRDRKRAGARSAVEDEEEKWNKVLALIPRTPFRSTDESWLSLDFDIDQRFAKAPSWWKADRTVEQRKWQLDFDRASAIDAGQSSSIIRSGVEGAYAKRLAGTSGTKARKRIIDTMNLVTDNAVREAQEMILSENRKLERKEIQDILNRHLGTVVVEAWGGWSTTEIPAGEAVVTGKTPTVVPAEIEVVNTRTGEEAKLRAGESLTEAQRSEGWTEVNK
jgi:hypothetical protein